MYARVSEFRVLEEKLPEFVRASKSVLPLIRREKGFRALLVLKGEGSPVLVRVVSLWESHQHMKASEKSLFLYQALSRVMPASQGFPLMEECEALVAEMAVEKKR